jgi:hypothetical protein
MCITALAGTDGIDLPPVPNKTNSIGAAIGAVVGYALVSKHRWAGLAVGAAFGYVLAPRVAGSVSSRAAVPAAPPVAAQPPPPQVPPPGGRPPLITSSQTVRLMPATALQPPPEVTQQTETDAFLTEWMQGPGSGPLSF